MKEFGAHLKRAREAAGLSLEDLHVRTRISRKNLRLLDTGDFPSIPQTYVRAFIREYARVVGLDEDDTLAMYNDLAERERGIPRPPKSIDSSNLLPHIDDTIEYVSPLEVSSSPIEYDGKPEIIDEEFVPSVKKSKYVRDDDASPIDIRTSSVSSESAPDEEHPESPRKTESASPGTAPRKEGKAATPPPPEKISPPEKSSVLPPSRDPQTASSKPPEQPRSGDTGSVGKGDRPAQPDNSGDARKHDADASGREQQRRPSVYDMKPPIGEQRQRPSDDPERKRMLGMGLVIVMMLAVGIYGLVYFTSTHGDDVGTVDSTAIRAALEAQHFIDTTQFDVIETDMIPVDTSTQLSRTIPEPVSAKPKVFARDDSLVLEAFTSAPVWFSVKMDTLRTERGSLSTNEHRVWKARDYFVITLGDAGAITFFLNGKEIGTLGEEGSVVKNVVLSRSQIRGE